MRDSLRLGLRLALRQPFTTFTAVVALTLGIGVANVGFAAMEAMLFSRLPFEGGERFVRILTSPLDAETYGRLAALPALEHLGAATAGQQAILTPEGVPEEVSTSAITPRSLAYVEAVPASGRLLLPEDAQPGAPRVALVSTRLVERTAGRIALGSIVQISGVGHTVVGIMPASFGFPAGGHIWTPLDDRFLTGAQVPDARARLFGVLAGDASLEQLSSQLGALATGLPSAPGGSPNTIEARGFTDLGEMAPVLSTAIVLVIGAVLIVIAANVGNLILARSFARSREFALRSALGASRGRLILQVTTEVFALGLCATALGTLTARTVLHRLNAMEDVPYWIDFRGGWLTYAMVAAATLMATAIAGALPALRATRRDAMTGLQAGGRASDVNFGRVAGAMVTAQIAVSVLMLHGALVVGQAFRDYANPSVSLPTHVLTMRVATGESVTTNDIERIASELTGVVAAGASTSLPRHSPELQRVEIEPASDQAPVPTQLAPTVAVSPTFFRTLAASVSAGREFTAADAQRGAPPVAIVNEPFARHALAGAALGRRIRAVTGGVPGPWLEIVGVAPDLGLSVGDPALAAGFYTPLTGDEAFVYLAVRVNGEPLRVDAALREELRRRNPALSVGRSERLEDVNADDRGFFAALSSALVGLGAVTLVLALAGVYSMMSLIVSRRTREIGIRMALGATMSQVITVIGRRAGLQVALGGAVGAGLAAGSLQFRSMLVSRMGDGGSWTLPVVLGLLLAAGLMATWVPLKRAIGIRPSDALRAE